mmetsp:Transcript_1027/g.3050  ORF Transcript_1027/g.3050 Transcript_1027/m.3050 type:complete len:195 (-) Transcript_1027:104-688(-)
MSSNDLEKTVELVQTSWQQIVDAGVTYEAAGGILFKHIFAIAPQAKPLFPFIPAEAPIDDALFEMPAVKKHGARVVKAVADAVAGLGELDALAPKLTALGARHVNYGVLPEHYDIVGEALVRTLGDALGESFTPDVKGAWVAVWTIVRNAMVSDHYGPTHGEKVTPNSLLLAAAAAGGFAVGVAACGAYLSLVG